MTLQLMQGWDDAYGLSDPSYEHPENYYSVTTDTRTGVGRAAVMASDYGSKLAILTPRATMIVGSAMKVPPLPYSGSTQPGFYYYPILSLQSVGGQYGYQGIELIVASGVENRLHVRTTAANGPDAASGHSWPTSFVLPIDRWFYAELKGRFAPDATGEFEARINGVTVLKMENLVTQSTSGQELINRARFGYCGYSTYHDDSYVVDTTGTDANDFLGDVRIAALRPSAPGDSAQWTPDSGLQNWDAANGDTGLNLATKVSAATPGLTDLYNVPDLTGNLEVLGVQVVGSMMRGQTSDPGMALLTKAGGATKTEGQAVSTLTLVPFDAIPAGTTNIGGPPTLVDVYEPTRATNHALACADLGDNTDTSFTFPYEVSATKFVAFRYAIQSEGNYDYGSIEIDGTEIFRLSGYTGWSQSTPFELSPGVHQIKVRYTKDSSASSGFDNIYVASMLLGDTAAAFAAPTSQTNAKVQVGVIQAKDPAGNAWSVGSINAMQIGMAST